MDKLIGEYKMKMVEPECAPGSARYGVLVSPERDISPVFPYLNAVMNNAWYDHENQILIWREQNQAYALRPNEIRIARASDPAEAQQIAAELVAEVNRTWQQRDTITPRFTQRKRPGIFDIFKLLPGTNCKLCGYVTCLAYAADLCQEKVTIEQCPPLSQPEYAEYREKVLLLISPEE